MSIEWSVGVSYEIHPLCLCVPPNSEAKRKAILESIKADPGHVVVTLYEGMILDGRTRYELCEEAGIGYAVEHFSGTAADAARFVADQLRPRRDLTATQRAETTERLCEASAEYRAWIEGLTARGSANEKSGKKVEARVDVIASKAAASGVSRRTQAQVQQARKEPAVADAMLSGEISAKAATDPCAPVHKGSEQRKITGGTAFNVEELTDIPLSEMKDGEGNPLPERCEEAFRECDKFDEAARLCSKVKSLINELSSGPASVHLSHQMATSDVTNCRTAIVFAKPHVPCPRKNCGEGCALCKGCGYLTKDMHKRLPAKERR